MSETIQSISQGTYTIGRTSATNFIAGPGIKIDEPSAGTVRIGNDETVLWEGTAFSPPGSTNPMRASAEMSESIQNFDQIRLDFRGNNYYFNDSVLLTHPYNTTTGTCYVNVKHEQANNSVFIGTLYKWINDTTLSGMCSFGTTQNVTAMTGGYYNYGAVVRVVGINRISGSNA